MRWIVAFLIAALASPAPAEDLLVPTVKAVVYPGDVLNETMLTDVALSGVVSGGPVALSDEELIGKMARRTLLPGRAIPLSAVDNPRVIRNGANVTMAFQNGALSITAAGAAMQDGAVGDTIKVRNADSGVTVEGRVRADGSVLVTGE